MKKEQKEIIKKYEEKIKKIVKPILNKYGYKNYGNAFYFKKEKDFFIHGTYCIRYIHGELKLEFNGKLKKYLYDNLFWEIINMSDNVNTPERFRANGAFVCPSYEIVRDAYDINSSSSIEKLLNKMFITVEKEKNRIITENEFSLYLDNTPPQVIGESYNTLRTISYIDLKKYEKAYCLAQQEHKRGAAGGFINEEKTFNEWAMEYCLKRMSETL